MKQLSGWLGSLAMTRGCNGLSGVILVLIGLFLTGCGSDVLTRLEDVSPNDAITVARFHIIYNGKDVTEGCGLAMRPLPAVAKNYSLHEGGYLYVVRPAGVNSIKSIQNGGLINHNFGTEELTCQLVGGGVINYLGDITITWQGMGKGQALGVNVLAGAIGTTFLTEGEVGMVKVENKAGAAQAVFQQKFSTTRTLTPSLLVVNFQH